MITEQVPDLSPAPAFREGKCGTLKSFIARLEVPTLQGIPSNCSVSTDRARLEAKCDASLGDEGIKTDCRINRRRAEILRCTGARDEFLHVDEDPDVFRYPVLEADLPQSTPRVACLKIGDGAVRRVEYLQICHAGADVWIKVVARKPLELVLKRQCGRGVLHFPDGPWARHGSCPRQCRCRRHAHGESQRHAWRNSVAKFREKCRIVLHVCIRAWYGLATSLQIGVRIERNPGSPGTNPPMTVILRGWRRQNALCVGGII